MPYRRPYYACICLMGDDVLDIVYRDPVARHELLDHVGEYSDGEFEDLTAVLEELFVVARVTRPPQRGPPAVRPEDVVHKARVSVVGVQHDGARAVAEKHRCRAFLLVDDGAHRVRPDKQ